MQFVKPDITYQVAIFHSLNTYTIISQFTTNHMWAWLHLFPHNINNFPQRAGPAGALKKTVYRCAQPPR